jgi:hypothetical protein
LVYLGPGVTINAAQIALVGQVERSGNDIGVHV